jgi:hypothetical protein
MSMAAGDNSMLACGWRTRKRVVSASDAVYGVNTRHHRRSVLRTRATPTRVARVRGGSSGRVVSGGVGHAGSGDRMRTAPRSGNVGRHAIRNLGDAAVQ